MSSDRHWDRFILRGSGIGINSYLGPDPSSDEVVNSLTAFRYNGNPNYFGGIVVFTKQHFIQINGFPNNFWGYEWLIKLTT